MDPQSRKCLVLTVKFLIGLETILSKVLTFQLCPCPLGPVPERCHSGEAGICPRGCPYKSGRIELNSTQQGVIQVPAEGNASASYSNNNYVFEGQLEYEPNLLCHWDFTSPPGTRIHVFFSRFSTEGVDQIEESSTLGDPVLCCAV